MDSGAERTVIGLPQTLTHCEVMNGKNNETYNNNSPSLIFGSHRHRTVGCLKIRVPISNSFSLSFSVDVVDVDAPLLLGNALASSKLILYFAENKVQSKVDSCSVPLE